MAKFTRKGKTTTKVAVERHEERQGKDAPAEFEERAVDADDISELVTTAKKHVKGVFTPADEDVSLFEVSDWIKMPGPIQRVMGTPGIPCGRVTQVYGKKDCGKTTFATEALVSTQRDGGLAILVDTENKYSLKRAAAMGLDVRRLIVIPAVTIEEAFDKFVTMVTLIKNSKVYTVRTEFSTGGKSYKPGQKITQQVFEELSGAHQKKIAVAPKYSDKKVCCVWDSLGATPSEAELDETKTDFSMTAAKVVKGRLRKLLRYIADTKVAFVIINQVYANMNMFGKKTTPYGGSGPEYHSAIIMEFTALGKIRPPGKRPPDPFCGIKTQIECVKNHLAQPFKQEEAEIDWRGFVDGRPAEYAPVGFMDEMIKESKKDKETDEPVNGESGSDVSGAKKRGGPSKSSAQA